MKEYYSTADYVAIKLTKGANHKPRNSLCGYDILSFPNDAVDLKKPGIKGEKQLKASL